MKDSRAKHGEEVPYLETKTNKALEDLKVDLVLFLPEEISDVIVRDLMGQFAKIRDN